MSGDISLLNGNLLTKPFYLMPDPPPGLLGGEKTTRCISKAKENTKMQFGEIIRDILEMHHILHAINFSSNLIWGWRRGWDERGKGSGICIKERRAVASLNSGDGGDVGALLLFINISLSCPVCPRGHRVFRPLFSLLFISIEEISHRICSYLFKPLGLSVLFLNQYLHDLYMSKVVWC